ncbi:hypothetical protein PF005_g30503 [Phytophthora fragariae]|uniref:Uncharacterized protein n=1 Tax=Phytophthora fragariae TaxID=53985 RepID=A0A6A3VC04_9STRA|nr:hypothetical protein PF003_g31630 [Phytophthora fragariae]KAE8884449.1 hypothetical protein PF003_g31629 [Phytophthora fragariae]KAE9163307.1 hypothetical protein PF005_g30503 [Phytophthora fragariae]
MLVLVAVLMPVLVAGLVLCCRCQLPAWVIAVGASYRFGLMLPVLVAGSVCCCRGQLPA